MHEEYELIHAYTPDVLITQHESIVQGKLVGLDSERLLKDKYYLEDELAK
jgi:hypothetical protein